MKGLQDMLTHPPAKGAVKKVVAGVAVLVLISAVLGECSPSQRSQVRHALARRFPDGMHHCFALSTDFVGMHVPGAMNETIYYDRSDLLSPTRHLWVAYAGPASDDPPELIAMLARRGVLERHIVTAHGDAQSSHLGPQQVSSQGFFSHDYVFTHDFRTLQVAIYTTDPDDPHFQYEAHTFARVLSQGTQTFPMRIYDGDLPPANTQYGIPLVQPYAVSVVSAACTIATIDSIDEVTRVEGIGQTYVRARTTLSQDAPGWMQTPAFSRAVGGIDANQLTAPVEATFLFDAGPNQLYWSMGTP